METYYGNGYGMNGQPRAKSYRYAMNQNYKVAEQVKIEPDLPLAMAYVPWQQWGEIYSADCALKEGTIFKDLNLVFCGERC